jgi:hypothetical protein
MAAGTGNLILKRGTVIPKDNQTVGGNSQTNTLIKSMPAMQINGLSKVVNAIGTADPADGPLLYAFQNFPNRLWVGINEFGSGTPESGTGAANNVEIFPMGGSPDFSANQGSNSAPAAARPIWTGAEIRADAAVYYGDDVDTVPVILKADWDKPSDLVLVTQKAIKTWATDTFGTVSAVLISQVPNNKQTYMYPILADKASVGNAAETLYVDSNTVPSPNGQMKYSPYFNILDLGSGEVKARKLTSDADDINIVLQSTGSDTDATITLTGAATTASAVTVDSTSFNFSGTTINATSCGSIITPGTVNIGPGSGSTSSGTLSLFTNPTGGLNTKTINIGTGGASGSITNITMGLAGGTGTTILNQSLRLNNNQILSSSGAQAIGLSGTSVDVKGSLILSNGIIANSSASAIAIQTGTSTPTVSILHDLSIAASKKIKFSAASGGGTVSLQGPSTTTSNNNYVLKLPVDAGQAGYVLTTDGTDTLSWSSTGTATSVGVSATDSGTYTLVLTATGITGANQTSSLIVDDSDSITYNTNTNVLNVGGDLVVGGNLTVDGTTTTINTATLTVEDKNIELGNVPDADTSYSGTIGSISGSGPWEAQFTTTTTPSDVLVGAYLNIQTGSTGGAVYGGTPASVRVLSVSGSIITYRVIGGTTPIAGGVSGVVITKENDSTASGGGITVAPFKTFNWTNTTLQGSTGTWLSSENISIGGGRVYAVEADPLLGKTFMKLYGATGGSLQLTPHATDTNNYTLRFPSNVGSANDLLVLESVAGGTGQSLVGQLSFISPSNISIGTSAMSDGVKVRLEKSVLGTTSRYPIPFLGSTAGDNPASTWSFGTGGDQEGASANSYLYVDNRVQTIQADSSANYTDRVTGLFYEVDESSASGQVGTLYCDYIGAMLDCGVYS